MKKLLLLFLFLIPLQFQAQDISGNWNWVTGVGENSFTLTLKKVSENNYRGIHCASYYGGNRIDCESDENNYSVALIRKSDNIFQGTIKSGYSQTTGNFQLQYLPLNNTMIFKITQMPQGISFIPQEAILERS